MSAIAIAASLVVSTIGVGIEVAQSSQRLAIADAGNVERVPVIAEVEGCILSERFNPLLR